MDGSDGDGETTGSDVVVVGEAAGAAGNMVVQIAKKLVGAKCVAGIAWSDDRCRFVERLGADHYVNYKRDGWRTTSSWPRPLRGGKATWVCILTTWAATCWISCCGLWGHQPVQLGQRAMLKNDFNIISMRIQIRGMIAFDSMHSAHEAIGIFEQAIKEASLRSRPRMNTTSRRRLRRCRRCVWNSFKRQILAGR